MAGMHVAAGGDAVVAGDRRIEVVVLDVCPEHDALGEGVERGIHTRGGRIGPTRVARYRPIRLRGCAAVRAVAKRVVVERPGSVVGHIVASGRTVADQAVHLIHRYRRVGPATGKVLSEGLRHEQQRAVRIVEVAQRMHQILGSGFPSRRMGDRRRIERVGVVVVIGRRDGKVERVVAVDRVAAVVFVIAVAGIAAVDGVPVADVVTAGNNVGAGNGVPVADIVSVGGVVVAGGRVAVEGAILAAEFVLAEELILAADLVLAGKLVLTEEFVLAENIGGHDIFPHAEEDAPPNFPIAKIFYVCDYEITRGRTSHRLSNV
jgi:hypothetical protein